MEWTITLLGAFAPVMGAVGLWSPERQAVMMGFSEVSSRAVDDYTPTLLRIVSLSTINTALVYLVAVARRWGTFAVFEVVARGLMGAGLLALALSGRRPNAFVGAVIREWAGGTGRVLLARLILFHDAKVCGFPAWCNAYEFGHVGIKSRA